MDVDGILGQSGSLGDFENVQVLDVPQKEYRPLPFGQVFRGIPDRLNLLVDQSPLFGGHASIGQPLPGSFAVDCGALRRSPKLEAPVAGVISNQVDGNTHEPGAQARIAPKRQAVPISLQEAVLRQRFCNIRVLNSRQDEAQDPGPVSLDHTVEVLNLGDGALHSSRRSGNPGCCSGFHAAR